MLNNWGSWLGIENENGRVKEEVPTVVNEEQNRDVNKPSAAAAESKQRSVVEGDAQPPQLLQKAKGLSGKFYKNK